MRKHRAFFLFCSLLVLTTIVYTLWRELSMGLTAFFSPDELHCYWSRSNGIMELGQGEWDEAMLVPSRCLFFHDTTCSTPNLTPRQACAVESAARNNRRLNVFLLFLASGHFSEKSKELADILETYDNVYIRRVRLSMYVVDTPLSKWFTEKFQLLTEKRKWQCKNFKDYIQMLTLWKYGGVALNLDSVVQTSLENLTTFVGVQDDQEANVSIFGVDRSTQFGRRLIKACLDVIRNTNVDNILQYNVTSVITNAVQNICYKKNVINNKCRQFTIFPPDKFYPIPVRSWKDYFDKSRAEETMKIIANAATIHLWSDYSQKAKADNATAYVMTAKKHCPKIYEHSAKKF